MIRENRLLLALIFSNNFLVDFISRKIQTIATVKPKQLKKILMKEEIVTEISNE